MSDHQSRAGQPSPLDRPIIRRLGGALAAGMVGGALTAVGLIATDIGGIGTLTLGSAGLGRETVGPAGGTDGDLTGAMLLVWGMAVLFGFVGLAISIMSLGDWSDSPPD
ncbi:hypothetical protein N825_06935 [Skermanella stibiiresistens SB22]|uniref:Uncharacterized protein n=1 Tax=Skermanella stibiiresistens SB22 TaxID=1385369 RepID=W9GZY6_9PROT|nr:hypothetical protein [Skermanella stibiiresistens]EWY39500.1 hypothetical protein N825_06935 [Skermanella stibiiresistens SB22]